MKKYYVYVLYSESKSLRFYVGMTENLQKRLKEHNSGKVTSTRVYLPWKILFFEIANSRQEAREREKFLKRGSGKEKIKRFYRSRSSVG